MLLGDKSGLHTRSCQDSTAFPHTKAEKFKATEAELIQSSVTLMTRKRSSFCESNVRTAHISATKDTLYLDHSLVPGDITIKGHTEIKDRNGVFVKRLSKTTNET